MQLLIAFDQLFNAILGITFAINEQSWADETLSSRCWRWYKEGKRKWPCRMIDAVFFCDNDKRTGKKHCELSFDSERLQRQMPPEARANNQSSG